MNLRATLPTGKPALGAVWALRTNAGLLSSQADAVLGILSSQEEE